MDSLPGTERELIADDQAVTNLKAEILRRLLELEGELADAGYETTSNLRGRGDSRVNVGEVVVAGQERPVIGGHLTPLRSAPIVSRSSPAVSQFITRLDDGDSLKGETHGFGIHYHYHNWKGVRTDVILSWDTRWTAPDGKGQMRRPLFWEFHAERNAKGAARAGQWQAEKRRSVHAACTNDLRRWPIAEFRNAGDCSLPVWPEGAILTPRPPTAIRTGRRVR